MNNACQTAELNGYCPVAYFAVGKPLLGNPEISTVHQGKTYHFVSEDAKTMFQKDPEAYLPQFGGNCAFGMSIEKTFPSDPTHFKMIEGKLYLFLNQDDTDALKLWNQEDEAKCLANANRHWASVRS